MKKFSLLFVFMVIFISFSGFTFSSTAYVYGTDKVVAMHFINPYDNSWPYDWVGTVYGVIDGVDTKFYCTDISHNLAVSTPGGLENPYINYGPAPDKIAYILINYYPFKSFGYPGSLSAVEREAASVQMAIWHYSDGVDVTTGDQPDIVIRAQEIIADAELNAGNLVKDASLVITPTGTPEEFYVTVKDQNNNPLSGITVDLTSPTGTLSSLSAVTGADGKTPVLKVTLDQNYHAAIVASINITIPKGELLYVGVGNVNSWQKLVLANPSGVIKHVTYTFEGVLPVELSSFSSNVIGRNVCLIWETKTEKNSDKFVVERISNSLWVAVESVKASVLSNSPRQYSYTDKNLQSGKYQYRLKMIDNDGTFTYSPIVNAVIEIPNEYSLMQNYPNPFNPSTIINYSIPKDGKVTLKVYDITGRELAILVNENQKAGHYSVEFDAGRLASGVYLYVMESGDFRAAKQLTLIK